MINERLPRTIANAPVDPGFTFVELMVSFAIIGILSLVIIINQRDFDKTVNLKNIAHEISILLREQQSHATNVLANETTDSYEDTDRGVIINTTDSNNIVFELFYDENSNGEYDSGDSLAPNSITVPDRYSIRQVCSFNNTNSNTRRIYCLQKTGGINYPSSGVGQALCQGNDGRSVTNRSVSPTVVFARPLLQPKMRVLSENDSGVCNVSATSEMLNDRESSAEVNRIEIVLGQKVLYNFNITAPSATSDLWRLLPLSAATALADVVEPPPVDENLDPLEIIVIEANGAIYVK
jgi:prepilin-type N-terminal cleavage/methylation domain-containing protein